MTLPNGADGLSPNITLAFPITAEGETEEQSLANRDTLDQPNVEAILKEEIKGSSGWNAAHEAGYAGLPSGVPMMLGMMAKMAEQLTGLPVSTWTDMWLNNPVVGNISTVAQDALGQIFTMSANMQSIFGNLNFLDPDFDPQAALESWIQLALLPTNLFAAAMGWGDLYESLTGESGGLGDLADLLSGGLFGKVSSDRLGVLPFTHLGTQPKNQLGDFDDPASIIQGGGWSHDPSTGRTTAGCLQVVANGTERSYKSELIDVDEEQEFNVVIYALWSGVAGSSTPFFEVRIRRFWNRTLVGSDEYLVSPNTNATQATWVQMMAPEGYGSDNYLVPAGTNGIVVELYVPATTTAGTIKFDDPKGTLVGGLPLDWVNGLREELNDSLANVQATWDALFSAFSFLGGSDVPLSNMANEAQRVAFDAFDALTLGIFSNNILGFRRNRSSSDGLEGTMVGSQPLETLGQGTTPTNFTVTQANSAGVMTRMPWDAKQGIIQWRSAGNTNVSDFRFNVYRMDDAGNLGEHLYTSPNLAAQLTSGWLWQQHIIPEAEQIDVEMGDIVAVEAQVVGSGTVNIAGTPTSWMTDNHPSSRMKRKGWRRDLGTTTFTPGNGTDPTGIAAASIPWSATYPYVALGINNFPPGYQPPITERFPGNNNGGAWSWTIPESYRVKGMTFDLIALGGGGGGQANYGTALPQWDGGNAGEFATQTIVYGTDVALGTTTISGYTGWFGANADGWWQDGHNGEASWIEWTHPTLGVQRITGNGGNGGGRGGTSAPNGKSPGTIEFPASSGNFYSGGGQVGLNQQGKFPGGGGGGAGSFQYGADGATGLCWIRAAMPIV